MADEPGWMRAIRRTKGGARLIAKYQRPKVEGAMVRLPDFVHVTGREYFALDKSVPRGVVKCVGPESKHVWGAVCDVCLRCGLTKTRDPDDACVPVSWWYCDPMGHWGRVAVRDVMEVEDGAVTFYGGDVFQNTGPFEPWWRGTLIAGVWSGAAIAVEGSQAVA